MVHRALEAAATLAKEGIEGEVIDLRTLSPLDMDTVIESVENDRPAGLRRRGQSALLASPPTSPPRWRSRPSAR